MADLKILLATENKHKLKEFQNSLSSAQLISLKEISFSFPLPPETGTTYRENALIKAKFVFEKTGLPTLADDSGFEVFDLNHEPGVFSARYLETSDTKKQCESIVSRLSGREDRRASFVCCLCLIESRVDQPRYFEGVIEGIVTSELRGTDGFGYDPIFIPDGYQKTFAEIELLEKTKISHRGRALAALDEYLSY